MCSSPRSDSAPLGGAAAVVRDRRDVGDRGDLEPGRLERPDRLLATGARPLDIDLDLTHPVLHRALCGAVGGRAGGVRRALPGALEAGHAGRAPADHGARQVGDRDDRVVERRLDVDVPLGDVLAFAAALLRRPLAFSHVLSGPSGYFFRRTPTVFFGPRRWRALVLVRWPRAGRLRRWRSPRYEPISMRRLMFSATSRRRSPSTLYRRSMSSRRRLTCSSVRSRTRVSGLMFVCARIFWLVGRPIPKT